METFLENSTISFWILHYGCVAIFGLLAMGIIAFPIPEETLMVAAGCLINQGHLTMIPTILAAILGSMLGISISYYLGKAFGKRLIHKVGGWIGLSEQRFQKVQSWFLRFGSWTLFIGYFIPGLRHFTGLSAGTLGLKPNRFALFAYPGALLWTVTFLSIGYFSAPLIFRA